MQDAGCSMQDAGCRIACLFKRPVSVFYTLLLIYVSLSWPAALRRLSARWCNHTNRDSLNRLWAPTASRRTKGDAARHRQQTATPPPRPLKVGSSAGTYWPQARQ